MGDSFRSSTGCDIVERPSVVSIEEEVTMVSCGFRHSLFLTENGRVFGAGTNKKSEMGLGNTRMSTDARFSIPIRLESLEMYHITKVLAGTFSAALTS